MSKGKHERPTNPKDADVEIAAGAKIRELRFKEAPQTETRFWGDTEQESASGSDRENLPDEVEEGVTYREAGIQWRAASKLVVDERLREAMEGEEQQEYGGLDPGNPEQESANYQQGREDER